MATKILYNPLSGSFDFSYRPAIGDIVTSATQGSVFFAGASGAWAQDNANFSYNDSTNTLSVIASLLDGSVAVTQSPGDNTTKIATTAFVTAAIGTVNSLSEVLALGNTTGATDIIVTAGQTIKPSANDGAALGVSGTAWSDLFIASGGVINFAAGDVTETHSTNTLTWAGATSGYVFNDGSIGIGTVPSSFATANVLHIKGVSGSVAASLKLEANSGKTWELIQPATNAHIGLYNTATSSYRLYIEEDGDIGMGTTSPSANLHIVKTTEQLRVGYDVSNYYSTTVSSTGDVTFDAVGSSSSFTFADPVGIGVGVNNPSAFLHILGTTEQARIGYDTSNYYSTTVSSAGLVTFNAVGSAAEFTFSDDVGIGITPTAPLHVFRSSGETFKITNTAGAGFYCETRSSASSSDIAFATLGTGNLIFRTGVDGLTQTTAPNIKLGGTANRGTTEGTMQLVLFNGTAPVGTLTNGVSLYSASGELRVMDAGGTSTLLSPHDDETNEWIFRSTETSNEWGRKGRTLEMQVESILKSVNDEFGWDYVKEYYSDDEGSKVADSDYDHNEFISAKKDGIIAQLEARIQALEAKLEAIK